MHRKPANFYRVTKSARKIIVADLGFLGDSVHLVPALWEIKRHYPAAQLHTLSAALGAELLGLAPCVDRAWAFPLTPQARPGGGIGTSSARCAGRNMTWPSISAARTARYSSRR